MTCVILRCEAFRGIFACATALLGGCYEIYFAVPDADWDVFHPAEDACGDRAPRPAT